MKIAVFGGTGRIGSKVSEQLSANGHEVIRIGSRSGDRSVDYTDAQAVEELLQQLERLDGIVVTVGGDSVFKRYHNFVDDDWRYGAERKLVAQFRLARLGEKYLQENGSVTLSSGYLSHYPHHPNPGGLATGLFNRAIDTFVEQTAPVLTRGIRLNVVNPASIVDPERRGLGRLTADEAATHYVESVEGEATGHIYYAWGGLPTPAAVFNSA